MNIVPHNHDFAREQCIEASFRPIDGPTDWDAVIEHAEELDVQSLTDELRAGEPYQRSDVNDLKVFRLQTRVRIAHRHRKGLPQYAEHTCARCGSRRADPVLGSGYFVGICLNCAEDDRRIPHAGSRKTSTGLHEAFDISTGLWGIAYSQERDRATITAIVVSGYSSSEEAALDVAACERFVEMFNKVCPPGCEVTTAQIFDSSDFFAREVPMSPEQWRAYLKKRMRDATPEEMTPYASTVRDACRQFFNRSH